MSTFHKPSQFPAQGFVTLALFRSLCNLIISRNLSLPGLSYLKGHMQTISTGKHFSRPPNPSLLSVSMDCFYYSTSEAAILPLPY